MRHSSLSAALVRSTRAALLPPLAIAISLVQAGCARIVVMQGDGSVQIDQRFGVLSLDLQTHSQPRLVSMRGLGLIGVSGGGATLGYERLEMLVLPPDDCRVVIWVERDVDNSVVRQLAAEQQPICIAGGDFAANNSRRVEE